MANPLYFIETGRTGHRWFIEVDRDSNSRAYAIGLIRSGEVDPVKVIEVWEDDGFVRDVTEELVTAAREGDPVTETPAQMARVYDRQLERETS